MSTQYPVKSWSEYNYESAMSSDKQANGLFDIMETKGVKTYVQERESYSSVENNSGNIPGLVQDSLLIPLARKLYKDGMINIDYQFDHASFTQYYKATVHVAQPGMKIVNVNGNRFFVDGEDFDNDDLIKAVRATFPERFI